jgi:hypothetical protein
VADPASISKHREERNCSTSCLVSSIVQDIGNDRYSHLRSARLMQSFIVAGNTPFHLRSAHISMNSIGLSISMRVDYDSASHNSGALPYKIHRLTSRCITNSMKMAADVKASRPLAKLYPLTCASVRVSTL